MTSTDAHTHTNTNSCIHTYTCTLSYTHSYTHLHTLTLTLASRPLVTGAWGSSSACTLSGRPALTAWPSAADSSFRCSSSAPSSAGSRGPFARGDTHTHTWTHCPTHTSKDTITHRHTHMDTNKDTLSHTHTRARTFSHSLSLRQVGLPGPLHREGRPVRPALPLVSPALYTSTLYTLSTLYSKHSILIHSILYPLYTLNTLY